MSNAPISPDKNDPSEKDDPSEKNDAAYTGRNRRRYERTTVLWQATLHLPDRSVECLIVNISASGAMVQLAEQMVCGDTVVLRNPRFGTFSAETVWHNGKQVGLNFKEDVEEVARKLGEILP
jgi:hypothetical protein